MPAETDVLSPEDVAILRLESQTIAGHTCKVLLLAPTSDGERLALAALRDHVAGRLERVPRMRMRLADDARQPAWERDPTFDIRNHVRPWPLPAPPTTAGLVDIVAERMTTRLDRTRPLWSIDLVELQRQQTALIVLLHHSLVDGASAVRVLSAILWDPLDPATGPLTTAERSSTTAERSSITPAVEPSSPFDLRGIVRRELLPRATDTPLDRHPSTRRRVALTRAPLSTLRRLGKTVGEGATVNDIVLCAVAGGLRRWLESHGGPLHGVRVKVPVSLHDAHEPSDVLGNHDSFMVVDLGVDEHDAGTRLRRIASQTRERKAEHDARSLDQLVRSLRHVSGRAAQALSAWADDPRVSSVNVSNVPGPRTPVAVMGCTVTGLWTLAEIADRHALRVAVISMADDLGFGLCADALAVPDPDVIADGITFELSALGA